MESVERVIEFLANCEEEDIRAGIATLQCVAPDETFARFREDLAKAINGDGETRNGLMMPFIPRPHPEA